MDNNELIKQARKCAACMIGADECHRESCKVDSCIDVIDSLADALEAAQKELIDYHHTQKTVDGKMVENARLRKINEQLTARAEKAEAENRWIPVSERMPKDPGWYQVFRKGHSHAEDGYFRGKTWSFGKHYGEVTHWRPLPEPPKGE